MPHGPQTKSMNELLNLRSKLCPRVVKKIDRIELIENGSPKKRHCLVNVRLLGETAINHLIYCGSLPLKLPVRRITHSNAVLLHPRQQPLYGPTVGKNVVKLQRSFI